MRALLDAGRSYLALPMEELRVRLTPAATVDRNTSYGSLDGLTEVHDPASSPARVFFGDPGGPILVYVGDRR
ncbi:MAG TPA: hypothetical protein VII47_16955, partial [Actinomycetota bacterium]